MPLPAPLVRGLLLALVLLAMLPAPFRSECAADGFGRATSRCSSQDVVVGAPELAVVDVAEAAVDDPDVVAARAPIRVATASPSAVRHAIGTVQRWSPTRDDPPRRPPRIV